MIYNIASEIAAAGKIIRNGGVVVFPAKCLYGLAVDALNPKAVERVFDIKQRPVTNPLLVLIDNMNQLDLLVQKIPPIAICLIKRFWPGNITLVFNALPNLSPALTAGTGKIGVRIPGHPVARELVKQVEIPITGTSANISGRAGCSDIALLDPEISKRVDMILDAGILKGGAGSTVVDVTCDPVKVLREGVVPRVKILELLDKQNGFF